MSIDVVEVVIWRESSVSGGSGAVQMFLRWQYFRSSRRRHTISLRDWSSDVCSSDLTQQPTNAVAGAAISPDITVAALDAHGNVATSFTGSITLTVANNAGGGAISGTTTVPATNGVASFPGISINKAGTGYTLTASNTGPTAATSAAFNITPGAATHLVFTQEPTSAASQAAIAPAVTVTALDASDNVATAFANAISVAMGNNAGGGALTGGAGQTPVAGVATFSGLSIDKV